MVRRWQNTLGNLALAALFLLLGLSACSSDTPTGTGDWKTTLNLLPADGAVITANFDLSIGATAVDSMVVYCDGSRLAVVTTAPFILPFTLVKFDPGEHSLLVDVFAGNDREQLSATVLLCHGLGTDVGYFAPSMSLVDLKGFTHELSASPGGKVLLLDFWGTWCPPCVAALPETQRLFEEYSDLGLKVLTVNSEFEEIIRPFIRENEYTFPVLLDTRQRAGMLFEIWALPAYFIIDHRGIIRHVRWGSGGRPMEDIIKELLEE